jgi:hypothetical protein
MRYARLLVIATHLAATDRTPVSYGFTTERYIIEMRVSFPAPYEGRRLELYAAEESGSRCVESFVGALAVVEFRVKQVADGRPAAASLREIVTVVDQSPGLPERSPYTMTIRLANGSGSDVQAFGYDESPLPGGTRAAEREAAKSAWRNYRQELYLDGDRRAFAVIEWHHTTTRICILGVSSPAAL